MDWDELEEARSEFNSKMLAAREELTEFVSVRLKWEEPGTCIRLFRGSFNVCVRVQRGDSDEHVVIRFPAPGTYGPWRAEKVATEAAVLRYLHKHTSVPVPRVLDSGTESESPQQIGPFIIMEFIKGESLCSVLKQPVEDESEMALLNPDLDNEKLDYVYEQLAGFLHEMSRLEFPSIGALTEDGLPDQPIVMQRPLTYDMNELVTFGDMTASTFATAPFHHASQYFAARTQGMLEHLETQRNIAQGKDDQAWKLLLARRGLARQVSKYTMASDDAGPFRLFCDDMRPSNMLVDPETFRITGILDLEFTNAMPAQYAYDVPWWILLENPATIITEEGKEKFLERFEPRKDQFLRAMERVEAKLPSSDGTPLSARMRESWESGRFWFNFASRNSFDLDDVYWEVLHTEEVGAAVEAEVTDEEKEKYLEKKRNQFAMYEAEKEVAELEKKMAEL